MAFKIGQNVVCVDDTKFDGFTRGEKVPISGHAYTVRALAENGQCLRLLEIVNNPQKYIIGTVECSFKATRFLALRGKKQMPVFTVRGPTLLPAGAETVNDNFERADGPLGSNWTNILNSIVIDNLSVKGGNATQDCVALYNAASAPAAHYAQLVVGPLVDDAGGPAVCCQGTSCYSFIMIFGGDAKMVKIISGVGSQIGSTYTGLGLTTGDVLRLAINGTILTPSVNGTPLATQTDSDLSGGQYGMHIFKDIINFDNWQGGPA